MAAALPAIGTHGQKVVASPPPSAPGGGERHLTASPISVANKLGKSRVHGKRDKEIVHRLHTLRAEQPLLTKPETSEYRNEYYQQLCIEILEEGFHEAFAEIYTLVEKQEETRRLAGPESTIWSLPRLPEQADQLEVLREHLSRAENFKREENLEAVYDEQVCLAEFFQNSVPHSQWLAEHFFVSSLKTASHKGGLMQAKAHRDVGLILEASGNDKESMIHLQNSYSILNTSESSESINLKIKVCEDLTRVFTKVGDIYAKEGDLKAQIQYLKLAHEKSQESCNTTLEGTTAYRLGVSYNKNKQPEEALGYLKSYLNCSESNNDEAGIGEACQELAKSHELSGNVEQAIALLQRRVVVAEKANDDVAIAQSCSALGAIFNSLGRYADAVDYFNKAYTTARAATSSNLDTISSSRVLYGVAAAHKMLPNVQTHVDTVSKSTLLKLLEWKDQRIDSFANKDG